MICRIIHYLERKKRKSRVDCNKRDDLEIDDTPKQPEIALDLGKPVDLDGLVISDYMCNPQDLNECVEQIIFESEMSRPLPRHYPAKEKRRLERVARKLENSRIKRTRNSMLKKILSEF